MGRKQELNFESRTRGLSQGPLQEAKMKWQEDAGGGVRKLEWAGTLCPAWVTSQGSSVPPVGDKKSRNSQPSPPAPQGAVYSVTGNSSSPTPMPSCPGWSLYVLIKPQPGGCGAVRAPAPQSQPPHGQQWKPSAQWRHWELLRHLLKEIKQTHIGLERWCLTHWVSVTFCVPAQRADLHQTLHYNADFPESLWDFTESLRPSQQETPFLLSPCTYPA